MASGENDPSSDVAAGLSELECKLRDLERAFTTLGVEYDGQPVEPPDTHLAPLPPPAPPSDAVTPGNEPGPAPGPPAPPAAPDVQDRIDDLTRSQERLSATVETLMADVSKLVDGLAQPPAAPQDSAPHDVAQPPPAAAAPAPRPAPAPDPDPSPPPSAVVHPLPLRPMPDEPTPPPPARSVRDYAPNPPPRPGAGDDAG